MDAPISRLLFENRIFRQVSLFFFMFLKLYFSFDIYISCRIHIENYNEECGNVNNDNFEKTGKREKEKIRLPKITRKVLRKYKVRPRFDSTTSSNDVRSRMYIHPLALPFDPFSQLSVTSLCSYYRHFSLFSIYSS